MDKSRSWERSGIIGSAMQENETLAQIVDDIRSSPKYRGVCTDTIWRIAAEVWDRYGALKPAIKAAKAKLHQVYSAYESPIDYGRAWTALEAAYASGDLTRVQVACRTLLSLHASTRERLPILDQFFAQIFSCTGVPHILLDLACGLGSLSLPWMDLPAGATYYACDIDAERVNFLNRYLPLAGVDGHVRLQDILCTPPLESADVALLLKSSACLEQQRKGSTLTLLDSIHAAHVVVSFPVKSLGRRDKGMPEHYARALYQMLDGRVWPVTRLDFATELVFVVDKRRDCPS